MARGPVSDAYTELPHTRVSFDVEAFDDALEDHGITFDHYKAFPCPDGLIDLGDFRAPHPDHSGCEGGFIYRKAGEVTLLFMGNSKEKKPDDMGYWDGSSAQVTVPRFYNDQPEKRVIFAPFDRLYCREFLPVETWQKFQCGDGQRERLKYAVQDIVYLRDARGKEYTPGVDVRVANGRIEWIGSAKPMPDVDMGDGYNGIGKTKGVVCGCRYTYLPYYYVGRVLHELRVAKAPDADGQRVVQRMPQAVLIHREFIPQGSTGHEPGAPGVDADSMRTIAPAQNSR